MIVVNGYVQVKERTGGGLDGDGNPLCSSDSFSEPAPCRIAPNRQKSVGWSNGNFFSFGTSSYKVFTEEWDFSAERVRLTFCDGRELGEFAVQDAERLEAAGMIKITV